MADNPYQSSNSGGSDSASKPPLLSLSAGGILLGVVATALAAAMLLPAHRGTPEAARRNWCLNNLKQIALALQIYHDENGSFPPAYSVDADGNRLHSWRTLILPYMEGNDELYQSIDLTKPWDDPANAGARASVVDAYLCPSAPLEDQLTTYQAVVGPEFLFSGAETRSAADVTDQHGDTIAIIEVDFEGAVHWMSPQDSTVAAVLGLGHDSRPSHSGTIIAAFVDGSVDSIDLDCPPATRRAMLTIAGGETLEE